MKSKLTRRDFIRTVAAASAFSIVPRHVLGGPGQTPPSEQFTRAIIGCGGISASHLPMTDGRLLALCDPDSERLANRMKKQPPEVKGYRDFRDILARRDIDIVHICTPPHWHALMTVLAAEAGKDIWCEKPMARTIGEAIRARDIVSRRQRIFRINTWFRFTSSLYGFGTPSAPLKKIVANGLLGWPIKVIVGAATGFNWKLETWSGKTDVPPEPVPPNLDYNLWLGPAPFKPYFAHRVHGSFRGYWDYDAGGLGDMGQHYLDPVQFILGKDDTSPVSVEVDTPPQPADAVIPWRRVTMKYADGCTIILDGDNRETDAPYLEGPLGKIWPGLRSNIPNLARKIADLPDLPPANDDFRKCVLTRQPFVLNEQNAGRSCIMVQMAACAVKLGRTLKFDPVALRFIGDDEANRLIDQPMRSPWHL
jgi:predicted dehydrogenase